MGSPRRNGVTAALTECFIDLWQSPEHEVTLIEAYRKTINPCIHCGYCKRIQGCRYDDDFTLIDRALREANLLVVASPVYGLGFPAPLKAVFDRTQRYFEAKFSLGVKNPIENYKPALLLAAYGSTDSRGVAIMQEHLRLAFRLMNASLEHTIAVPNTDRIPVNKETLRSEMTQILKKLEAIYKV
jgi:multimeric flavodoxin WrbA